MPMKKWSSYWLVLLIVLRDFLQVDRSTPTAKSLLTIKIL